MNFLEDFLDIKVKGVVHSRYGDLSKHDSVIIDVVENNNIDFLKDNLLMHLTVTGLCNARCSGCINSELTSNSRSELLNKFELDPTRDARGIYEIASLYPDKEVVVALYGGEPLLNVEGCVEFIDELNSINRNKDIKYMVYTNGMLIDECIKRFPDFFHKIWLISLSIDGRETQHNRFRTGTDLKKIISNLKLLKSKYKTRVIMWSTLREDSSLLDCYLQFKELYTKGLCDYFFYHFAESKEKYKDLKGYVKRYERDLEYILEDVLRYLLQGEILPIIHLNELITFLLLGHRRGHTGCGVELKKNFDIVGGKILPCADLPEEFCIGNLDSIKDVNIKTQDFSYLLKYKDLLQCDRCGIEPYCGGRCPVQSLLGSPVRTMQICQLLRIHVAMVKDMLEDILPYLKKYNLDAKSFYLNSGYLSKVTDVIP